MKTAKDLLRRAVVAAIIVGCQSYCLSVNLLPASGFSLLFCIAVSLAVFAVALGLMQCKIKIVLLAIAAVLAAVVLASLVLLIFYFETALMIFDALSTFFYNAAQSIFGYALLNADYYLIALVFYVIVLVVPYVILSLKLDVSAFVMLWSLIFLVGEYFIFSLMSGWFLFLYMFGLILQFIRFLNLTYRQRSSGLSASVPYFTVGVITAGIACLVALSNPAPLKFIKEFVNTQRATNALRADTQSRLSNLSDSFYIGTGEYMKITTTHFAYLRGATFDQYNSSSWQRTSGGKKQTNGADSYREFSQTLEMHDIGYITAEISVEMTSQSKSLFVPLYSIVTLDSDNDIYMNQEGDLFTTPMLSSGAKYYIEMVMPAVDSSNFFSVLTSKSAGMRETRYLDIPQTLPDRVYQLSDLLTQDVASDYEKAKEIESFLRTEYEYTLEPISKPPHQDYVDFFLFDSKQGFCTHYASAMVMLLRAADIPCRYVTGYILQPSESDLQQIPDYMREKVPFVEGQPYTFIINKKNSHSWVEVYFEDFGWVAFEPTAGYSTSSGDAYEYKSKDVQLPGGDSRVEHTEQPQSSNLPFYVATFLIVTALALICIRVTRKRRLSNRYQILHMWGKIKRLYRKEQKKQNAATRNLTVREFANIIRDETLLRAAEIYEICVYSSNPYPHDYVDEMKAVYRELRSKKKGSKPL